MDKEPWCIYRRETYFQLGIHVIVGSKSEGKNHKKAYQNWVKVFNTVYCFFLGLIICRYSVQFSSVAQSCLTLCDPMNRSTPGLPVHHQLLEFTQTHVHRVGDAIQPSHPPSSPFPPALNLSQPQDLLQWVRSLHQAAKLLELQLQHQFFQWNSGLISFRINWFDLLAVWETLKEASPAPQFESISSSVLSLLYSPTLTSIHDYGKTIALTRCTFVSKVISLLFNILSRLVIGFLPRSKSLLILW